MVLYGQVVVGPPGAGKTTYCTGMQMFLDSIERKTAIINLDFANDRLPYKPSIDVRDLITLQKAMEDFTLGPNGGLVFCMESLLHNIEWLLDQIEQLDVDYVIFDCPGQVELYTHHNVVHDILNKISKAFDIQLCCVHLLDSFYCSQPATFISAVLLITNVMLKLGLPHINVLSKVDLLTMYGDLPFTLDFFTEMLNLSPLLRYVNAPYSSLAEIKQKEEEEIAKNNGEYPDIDEDDVDDYSDGGSHNKLDQTEQETGRSKLQQKYYKMTEAICEVVENYGLVSFVPLNIEDVQLVARVLAAVDKANGYSLAIEYAQYQERIDKATDRTIKGEHGKFAMEMESTKKTPKRLYEYLAGQLESTFVLSMDVHEKYGQS